MHAHTLLTSDRWRLALWELQAASVSPSAPPILCIHGFSQSHLTFTAGGFAQSLAARGIPTYLLDLRGHGGSAVLCQQEPFPDDLAYGWDTASFLHHDIAAALAFVRQRHGNQPVVLCGHSMGGALALAASLRDPLSVGGLVLLATPSNATRVGLHLRWTGRLLTSLHQRIPALQKRWRTLPMRDFFRLLDTAYHRGRPNLSALLPLLLRYDTRQVWPQLWHPALTPTETVRAMFRKSYPEAMGVVRDIMRWAHRGTLSIGTPHPFNYTAHFHRIRQPVVAVWGERDILAPPTSGDQLFSLLETPYQKRLHLPDTRHLDITAGTPAQSVLEAIDDLYAHLQRPPILPLPQKKH